MDWLKTLNDGINSFVWGVPMLVFILGSGLYLSIRTGFVQIFEFKYAIKNTLGRFFTRRRAHKTARTAVGAMSPFQALTTALASTVGTGNIAGITSAITMGGPGAVFWLWMSSLIGMCTKYAEVVLAVRYRERSGAGEWVGGPMYYIKNGLDGRFKTLAAVFSVCGAIAACGVGNAVQVGNMTASIKTALNAFFPQAERLDGRIGLVIGLVAAAITALTLFGGVKRIGRVTEVIVPFMAALYIIASLVVIAANIGSLGPVLARIFDEASRPHPVPVERGHLHKNSRQLGSAPRRLFKRSRSARRPSPTLPPVTTPSARGCTHYRGVYRLCRHLHHHGLDALMSGIHIPYGTAGSITMNISALPPCSERGPPASSLPPHDAVCPGHGIGWALYGVRCAEFLSGPRIINRIS